MFENLYYSKSCLYSLNQEVIENLKNLNLFTPIEFKCILFDPDRGVYSPNKKTITIAQISIKELMDRLIPRQMVTDYSNACSMKEILYHEYGHAYSDKHSKKLLFREPFDKLFGDYNSVESSIYNTKIHISKYASTNPDEDFSECFMYYVKWKGNYLKKRINGKKLINGVFNKIEFIDKLSKDLK
jgi:hypothetical protein